MPHYSPGTKATVETLQHRRHCATVLQVLIVHMFIFYPVRTCMAVKEDKNPCKWNL